MIIDNLKEFMTKLSDTSQKNNDCYEEDVLSGDPVCEKEFEFETDEDKDDFPEIYGGIISPEIIGGIDFPAPDIDIEDPEPDIVIKDVDGPCIHDDEIDEPAPCVYGPAPEYEDDLDICDPDEDDFIEKKDAQ